MSQPSEEDFDPTIDRSQRQIADMAFVLKALTDALRHEHRGPFTKNEYDKIRVDFLPGIQWTAECARNIFLSGHLIDDDSQNAEFSPNKGLEQLNRKKFKRRNTRSSVRVDEHMVSEPEYFDGPVETHQQIIREVYFILSDLAETLESQDLSVSDYEGIYATYWPSIFWSSERVYDLAMSGRLNSPLIKAYGTLMPDPDWIKVGPDLKWSPESSRGRLAPRVVRDDEVSQETEEHSQKEAKYLRVEQSELEEMYLILSDLRYYLGLRTEPGDINYERLSFYYGGRIAASAYYLTKVIPEDRLSDFDDIATEL